MIQDWTGNSVAYAKTLGATSHGSYEREKHDYYATEPKAVNLLLELEDFNSNIWECACGEGHMSLALEAKGKNVYSTDLIDRGYGHQLDFLTATDVFNGDIITNPPYKFVDQFILKGHELINEGSKLALFLPIRYLEGKARKEIYKKYPPKNIYVSSSRLKCAINGEFEKMTGSAVSYAWFIWEKGFKGKTTLDWFN